MKRERNVKNYFLIALIIGAIFLIIYGIGYKKYNDPPIFLEDIAYNVNEKLGYTVFIKENGEYVSYLVLTNKYYGNSLLIRKDCLSTQTIYNSVYIDNPSYYENCIPDVFLNTTYINTLSENIRNSILDVSIPITAQNSIGCCGNKVTKITRKIFLLSLKEVGDGSNRKSIIR